MCCLCIRACVGMCVFLVVRVREMYNSFCLSRGMQLLTMASHLRKFVSRFHYDYGLRMPKTSKHTWRTCTCIMKNASRWNYDIKAIGKQSFSPNNDVPNHVLDVNQPQHV